MAKVAIQPQTIEGPWDAGYVLDKHLVSSTFLGQDQFGRDRFDNTRTVLGELVYQLKNRNGPQTTSSRPLPSLPPMLGPACARESRSWSTSDRPSLLSILRLPPISMSCSRPRRANGQACTTRHGEVSSHLRTVTMSTLTPSRSITNRPDDLTCSNPLCTLKGNSIGDS